MKQENLNPEIEEKLLNLQRFQEKQMKGEQQSTSVALAHNHHEYTSPIKQSSARKRLSVRGVDDEEWIGETPKRRPPRTISSSEKKTTTPNTSNSQIEQDVDRIIRSVEEETKKQIQARKELALSIAAKEMSSRRAAKRENDRIKQQHQQLQVSSYYFWDSN